MGFTYRNIERAAYRSAAHAQPWSASYRALPFPEHIRGSLLALYQHSMDEEQRERRRTVPTRRLDGVLQSLAPDLIVRPRPSGSSLDTAPDDYWLYVPDDVPDPLPGRTFQQLLAAWLRTLGPKDALATPAYQKQLLTTLAELETEPPAWQSVTDVDLLDCGQSEGGTAAPSARQFQLATDALARRIAALDPYPFEGGSLRFRAVPRGPREQGAELMSQPLPRQIKGKDWWFSVLINVSLHTTPFDPRPRLHLHFGVRRWATHPRTDTGRLHLPFRRATSVYLLPRMPWLPGAPLSDRYAIARLKWDRSVGGSDWVGNDPAGILRALALRQPFPEPELLLGSPQDWLGEGGGVRAAVVHSTAMGAHGIGAGLMSHQRSQLTEWAEQALPEALVRMPGLSRSTAGGDKPGNARPKPVGNAAKKAEETRVAHARRSALAVAARPAGNTATTGKPCVEARLLWQTAELRQSAINALAEILGLDGDGGAPQPDHRDPDAVNAAFNAAVPGKPVLLEWDSPELTVRLRCLPLADGLADALVFGPKTASKGRALADAVRRRRERLRGCLADDGADPATPTLALVEIAHPSTFRPSLTDPKFAVRLGCADAGVLTQFAVVPSAARAIKSDKNVDHRVRSGWLDGLRQLGVRVLPEHTLGANLPESLDYAAVWMVKRRKDGPTRLPLHLPVAVRVCPDPGGNGLAHVQGWDDDALAWIPYPAFLVGLVKKAEIPGEGWDPAEELSVELAGTPERAVVVPAQRDDDTTNLNAPAGPAPVTRWSWHKNMDRQRGETARFLQRMIFSLRDRPTVLITHSQNSRQHWPWLQDGKAVADLIRTGHAPASSLDPDLRLVRVRGAAGRETPQWWGTGSPDGVNGLPAGLWVEQSPLGKDQRVFYSTTEKASQFTAAAKGADRLAPRVLTRGPRAGELTSDADKPAWNPALVEIAVLACHIDGESADTPGDQPEALALAMHQLRQAPDYQDALSLPLPLHLAGLAQAYVLPVIAEAAEVEDADAEADPDLVDAPGLAQAPEEDGQLALFG
ncbi:pPIWI_RE module domain-containing protein [Kitasatospora sp. NPDC004289]